MDEAQSCCRAADLLAISSSANTNSDACWYLLAVASVSWHHQMKLSCMFLKNVHLFMPSRGDITAVETVKGIFVGEMMMKGKLAASRRSNQICGIKAA